jgi:hypothetical protein
MYLIVFVMHTNGTNEKKSIKKKAKTQILKLANYSVIM